MVINGSKDVQDLSFVQVRYELLDCNHAFLDSAMKLVDLMEHGAVKGGERLVPHLFQFLVLLANDQSKLVTVPQVCYLDTQMRVSLWHFSDLTPAVHTQ